MTEEIAWVQVELLDVIARKGSKVRRSLIRRSLRPKAPKRKPTSMSDPAVRGFFRGKPGNPPPAP